MAHRYRTPALLLWVFMACVFLSACGGGDSQRTQQSSSRMTFIHDGLQGLTIYHLYQHHDQLFAATSNGLYIKTAAATGWKLRGLMNFHVTDLVVIDHTHFIAIAHSTNPTNTACTLLETTTAGYQWHPLDAHSQQAPITDCQGLSYARDVNALYLISNNLALTSFDGGRDWQPVIADATENRNATLWVARHPVTGDIWSGGYKPSSQPWLQAWSTDSNRVVVSTPAGKKNGPVYHLYFDPQRAETLLLSNEDGWWRSDDYGNQWAFLLAPPGGNRIYRTLRHDPINPQWLYSSSQEVNNQGPQRLIFEMSQDLGVHWTRYYYPDNNLQGGTQSMLAVVENHKTVVYLGLVSGGIVKVEMPSY